MQQHTDGLGIEYLQYDQNGDTTSITSTDAAQYPNGQVNPHHVNIHLSYDAQARPITVTTLQTVSQNAAAVPVTVTMAYNGAGQRSRYTVVMSGTVIDDEHVQYRADAIAQVTAVTATLNANGSVATTQSFTDTYVYGPDGTTPLELLRQYAGQSVQRYWYEVDGRGNVIALTDVNGTVVDRYAYDPWGEGLPQGTSESVPQHYRYAGYWWDTELG